MPSPRQHSPITKSEARWLAASSTLVIFLTTLPYLVCLLSAGPEMTFTGIMVNPSDGFSYLAKIRMGWEGNWIFHLPFTTERGPGAYLNLFYLALGHIARLLHLPLPLIFHIARILGGYWVLVLVYGITARITDSIGLRKLMWLFVALLSGFGWIVEKFGFGYSYYVKQTILSSSTFYTLLLNAHGPISIAIMLTMFMMALAAKSYSPRNLLGFCVLSLSLAVILPFAVVTVYLVLACTLAVLRLRDGAFSPFQLAMTLVGGITTVPMMLYMHFAVQNDPTLSEWSLQNLTPSPSILNLIVAYGLLVVFLVPGVKQAWKRRSDWDVLLITWIVAVFIAMYIPYSLQFRFSVGMHIPIAILAAEGLVASIRSPAAQWSLIALMGTNTLYLTANLIGRAPTSVAIHNYELMYISKQEENAYSWLEANVAPDKIVLGSPPSGLLIPAFAGQKVIYGHTMETVAAVKKKQWVMDFFTGKTDGERFLKEFGVDYVILGPREKAIGHIDPSTLPLREVFQSGDVKIYKVEG